MSDRVRIAVHWISPVTYLRSCVEALSATADGRAEIALTFVAGLDSDTAHFDDAVLPRDVSIDVLKGPRDVEPLRRFRDDPFDLHMFSGRRIAAYRRLARSLRGRARRVYVTDHPMLASRELVARILWFRTVGRVYFDFAFVTGDRQAAHARVLGFRAGDVWPGAYAAARPSNLPEVERRDAFLFVGRLVEEKGVRQLAEGYQRYRSRAGADAWPLIVVGIGPLRHCLEDLDGVVMRGFLGPADLWLELLAARAFVLPSIFEPWGVVLHEAALAELPLVASAECGAIGHLLRDGWNGWVLRSLDPETIARTLQGVQGAGKRLEVMGGRSALLAGQFSPEQWADAVLQMTRA